MGFSWYQTVFHLFIVSTFAYLVYGDGGNKEMAEQGRVQYQLIEEKRDLPKYGPCWRSALEHLDEGCRQLSEDTQSDIALHITNCFLEMSGHKTYNCANKKPDLRASCINSMSDRAFNVYTEFYTHTQNICWFLRGQIWHETIAENTMKLGKQLEVSAELQQDLLRAQRESIELQEKMLIQERFLGKVLEDVYSSVASHQEILKLLDYSLTSLQNWLVGEISWIDCIRFNVFVLSFLLLLTGFKRTATARYPLLLVLFISVFVERLICSLHTKYTTIREIHSLYSNLYDFVWCSRFVFLFIHAVVILYFALTYCNVSEQNLYLLPTIKRQNSEILDYLETFKRSQTFSTTSSVDVSGEERPLNENGLLDVSLNVANKQSDDRSDRDDSDKKDRSQSKKKKKLSKRNTSKYNLRSGSKHDTPSSEVTH